MTTFSTNTTIAHTSNATFQAWATEIDNALVTQLGLTNTADTGQTATNALVYNATLNTIAGYRIYRFNDALQATSPIFIKLEFGTGSNATAPQLLITISSSTNGAGTMTGIVSTRCACMTVPAPASTVTNYTSRYCYNTTQGFLGMAFKIGAASATVGTQGGFLVYRSVDNTGAPTANSAQLVTNSASTTSTNSQAAGIGAINYSLSVTVASAVNISWSAAPWSASSTIEGTTSQIFPCWQHAATATTPPYGITNAICLGILAEEPIHSTFSATILGSLSLTYIATGTTNGSGFAGSGLSGTTYTQCMLWQ